MPKLKKNIEKRPCTNAYLVIFVYSFVMLLLWKFSMNNSFAVKKTGKKD